MLRCASVWLLLATPFYFLARTDLVEEWTSFAWILFYTFVGFGIFSLGLSLFEDSDTKAPAIAVEPVPQSIVSLGATESLPLISPVPAPVVALALGVSAVALASSAQLEIPTHQTSSLSLDGPSGPMPV